jgi:hypothetical protein
MLCPRSAPFASAAVGLVLAAGGLPAVGAQADLDDFMRQVMERRDDNWKKLQQYILDEREELDVRGPGQVPIWGERSEYTWFIRDGYFVRSPLKINGATVGEDDRRTYEANYLRRSRLRDQRERERDANSPSRPPAGEVPPATMESFIQQTRQPEFVSSAYFLRFKFDSGRYALVGREKLDGQEMLRVEYYPTKLFLEDDRERERRRRRQDREIRLGGQPNDKGVDDTVNRLMNRGSRVTLWIEPAARQIVKYTFDNVDMDFFPAQWLASVTGIHASMTMGQPFPDVWLPRETEFRAALMFAIGEVNIRGMVTYHDYRRAEVTTGIRAPGAR